jgi:hypothetical protein
MSTIKTATILATYTPDGWARILAVAADRKDLRSYPAMELFNAKLLKGARDSGQVVLIVAIDADALIAWCRAERRPLDSPGTF